MRSLAQVRHCPQGRLETRRLDQQAVLERRPVQRVDKADRAGAGLVGKLSRFHGKSPI